MFGCSHKWKILETTILPSYIEQMKAAGVTKASGDFFDDISKKYVIVKKRCFYCDTEEIERI